MNFHIITLFPEMFDSYFGGSILKRAQDAGYISVRFYNPRNFTKDKHKTVDDKPYGGGPGMVMMVDPLIKAWEKAVSRNFISKIFLKPKKIKTYIFSPGGEKFTTKIAKHDAEKYTDIVLICGRYEGIDSRVKDITSAEDLSIGDYVLTGGEIPAMVFVDSVSRQIEGVLGKYESLEEERVSSHEMYTRPEHYEYRGKKYSVPEIFLSGHHQKIEEYKKTKL